MRGQTPTMHCDADDGFCSNWDVDHYETGASSVDSIRLSADQRSPGWSNRSDVDLCPEHARQESDS